MSLFTASLESRVLTGPHPGWRTQWTWAQVTGRRLCRGRKVLTPAFSVWELVFPFAFYFEELLITGFTKENC